VAGWKQCSFSLALALARAQVAPMLRRLSPQLGVHERLYDDVTHSLRTEERREFVWWLTTEER
jgi:hypothetical protein